MDDIKFLRNNSNKLKADFDRKLINTKYEILGVKNDVLVKYAKNNINDKINLKSLMFYEQVLIEGYKIAYSNIDSSKKIILLKKYLPYVDNWATCDAVASRLKGLKDESDFFIKLLSSKNTFDVRFAVVWLMKNLLKEQTNLVLSRISEVSNQDYYVQMAIAWVYAEAFSFAPDFMLEHLSKIKDKFIRNNTITKVLQSRKVDLQIKNRIKCMRLFWNFLIFESLMYVFLR